jgi:hypothetical protein
VIAPPVTGPGPATGSPPAIYIVLIHAGAKPLLLLIRHSRFGVEIAWDENARANV